MTSFNPLALIHVNFRLVYFFAAIPNMYRLHHDSTPSKIKQYVVEYECEARNVNMKKVKH